MDHLSSFAMMQWLYWELKNRGNLLHPRICDMDPNLFLFIYSPLLPIILLLCFFHILKHKQSVFILLIHLNHPNLYSVWVRQIRLQEILHSSSNNSNKVMAYLHFNADFDYSTWDFRWGWDLNFKAIKNWSEYAFVLSV